METWKHDNITLEDLIAGAIKDEIFRIPSDDVWIMYRDETVEPRRMQFRTQRELKKGDLVIDACFEKIRLYEITKRTSMSFTVTASVLKTRHGYLAEEVPAP